MKYDKNRYKNLSSPWKQLFWFISPLSVFFDILGIRIPKITMEEQIPDIPFIERRYYTPCPHCNTFHDSRIWLQKNIFANWFGLYCPTCGNIIPCQKNAISCLILFISYPLWGFKDKLRIAWLRKQPDRYRNLTFDYFSKTRLRIQSGVCFVLCYITVQLFFKILSKENVNGHEVCRWIFSSIFSGLAFAYYMSYSLYKKINHETKN